MQLFELAERYRLPQIAAVFRAALIEELGPSSPAILNKLASPSVIMRNPRKTYGRDTLVEGFDEHMESINSRGDSVEAITIHFHTSGGQTVLMPVEPPEGQSPKVKRRPPIIAGRGRRSADKNLPD
jgi:hypothetical protein